MVYVGSTENLNQEEEPTFEYYPIYEDGEKEEWEKILEDSIQSYISIIDSRTTTEKIRENLVGSGLFIYNSEDNSCIAFHRKDKQEGKNLAMFGGKIEEGDGFAGTAIKEGLEEGGLEFDLLTKENIQNFKVLISRVIVSDNPDDYKYFVAFCIDTAHSAKDIPILQDYKGTHSEVEGFGKWVSLREFNSKNCFPNSTSETLHQLRILE